MRCATPESQLAKIAELANALPPSAAKVSPTGWHNNIVCRPAAQRVGLVSAVTVLVLLQRRTLEQTQRGINMPAPRSDVCSAVFPHALQEHIMANTCVAVNMSLGLAGTKDDTGLA